MPVQFFQKQLKPNIFSKKTVFKYKNAERKLKKEPPKRTFKARKFTLWALFCSVVLFPLLSKVVSAQQHAMLSPSAGAAAGGVGAAAGVVGAVAAGSVGLVALSATGVLGGSISAALMSVVGPLMYATPALAALGPVGWIIIAAAIVAIALLIGFIACGGCGLCDQQDDSQAQTDTANAQQGLSSQVTAGSSTTSNPSAPTNPTSVS